MTTELRIERIDADHVRVSGRLGFGEAAAAWLRGDEVIAAGSGSEIAVDVAGVHGIDSATLAVLLAWASRARRGNVALRFQRVPAGLGALAHLCSVEPLLGMA